MGRPMSERSRSTRLKVHPAETRRARKRREGRAGSEHGLADDQGRFLDGWTPEIAGAGALRPKDIGALFRRIAIERVTGTLSCGDDVGDTKLLHFRNGALDFVKSPRMGTRLGHILLRMGKLTSSNLRHAVAAQQLSGVTVRLGEVLREEGFATEGDILEALTVQAVEDVLVLLKWPRVRGQYVPGAAPDGLFDGEDDVALGLDPALLATELDRRREDWTSTLELLPSLHDVYRPTEGEFDEDSNDELAEVADGGFALKEFVDGIRDVADIVGESRFPEIEVVQGLHALKSRGEVEMLGVEALVGLADDLALEGDHRRALARATRACELGGVRLDVVERVAMAHVALGETERAVSRLVDHAHAKAGADEHDEALGAIERALSLAPDREELIKLHARELVATGRRDEASKMLCRRAAEFEARGDEGAASEMLRRAVEIVRGRSAASRQLAELHARRGEVDLAVAELDALARRQLAAGEIDDAIDAMTRRIELEASVGSLDALARVLIDAEKAEEASIVLHDLIDILEALATDGKGDAALLAETLERALELDPARDDLRERLVRAYAEEEELGKAFAHYDRLRKRQERSGDEVGLVRTLEAMRDLAPDRFDVVHLLASTLEKIGRKVEAARALGEGAERASRAGERELATTMLRRAVELAPLELEVRMRLASELVARGDRTEALLEYTRIGEIYRAIGRAADAAEAFRRALECQPDHAELRLRLAEALDGLGRAVDASREYVRAAKFAAFEEENFGTAMRALYRARELDPRNERALYVLESVQRCRQQGAASGLGLEEVADARIARAAMGLQRDDLDDPVLGLVDSESGEIAPLFEPVVNVGRNVDLIVDRLRGVKVGDVDEQTIKASRATAAAYARLRAVRETSDDGAMPDEPPPPPATEAEAEAEPAPRRETKSEATAPTAPTATPAGVVPSSRLPRPKTGSTTRKRGKSTKRRKSSASARFKRQRR